MPVKGHEKVLELNASLSKLLDAFCFQLAVNLPDENSLSLLEILEWKKQGQINQEQLVQLYSGWLQSKNIYDIFTVRQLQTYPKHQLIEFEGPVKQFLNIKQITKALEVINSIYNDLFIRKRIKNASSSKSLNPKTQISNLQQTQKLFSFLDSQGVINLKLNELFFLTAAIMISQSKTVPTSFGQYQVKMKQFLNDMNQIDGNVSLRSFKNYFLVQKGKHVFVKNLHLILVEVQSIAALASQIRFSQNSLPNIFDESIQKLKTFPKFKGQLKKVQFLRRVLEQNQRILLFSEDDDSANTLKRLQQKYGKQLLNCLELDVHTLSLYLSILSDTVHKYLNIFQRVGSLMNKNKSHSNFNQALMNDKNVHFNKSTFQTAAKKKTSYIEMSGTANKPSARTAYKEKTPVKRFKNNIQVTPKKNRNQTPTHRRDHSFIHRQFGSAEKKTNNSVYMTSGRQTTPTKSTLSFMTQAPRTYRAAQKRGVNSFYDKLFFFRNKRVQSYEIVMKRLKNK